MYVWQIYKRTILASELRITKYLTLMMTSSNGNISALLALCEGNSPVTDELPSQRPVTRSFDVSFHLRLNKRLSKQSWGWLFETPSRPLWRHCNVFVWLWERLNCQYFIFGGKIHYVKTNGISKKCITWSYTEPKWPLPVVRFHHFNVSMYEVWRI